MLTLRMIHGMAKSIALRVNEIKHHATTAEIPIKRQTLRQFARLVLNTINILLRDKEGGPATHEERELWKRFKLVKKDIHTMLASVDADIDEDEL